MPLLSRAARSRAALVRADAALFRRLHDPRWPVLDAVLPRLTRAADHGLLWMATAAALAATGSTENRRAALRGVGSLAVASALANGPVKWLARRDRPDIETIDLVRRLSRQPVSWSFPSGHSASAAAFATGVALERPRLGGAVGVAAAGVAASRVRVGVHYPADVLAGVALGAAAALALTRVWPPPRPVPEKYRAAAVRLPALPDGAGLILVTNAASGGGDGDDLRRAVAEALPAAEIREVDEGEDLAVVLARAAQECQVLGVAGGDGSVNAAARAAVAADRPLLVLPAGTLNHFAGAVGVDTVAEALEAVRVGSGVLVDVAVARTGDDDGHPAVFLNNASVGAYPKMVAAREQIEDRLGKWPAMVVALLRILHRSEPITVQVDGVPRQLWLLFAGNGVYSPPGFAPSWRDHLDDGLLDLRLLDGALPFARARLIAAVLLGRLARSPAFETRTATQVQVQAVGDPVRLARDGEVGDPLPGFTLAKGPRLAVYRP